MTEFLTLGEPLTVLASEDLDATLDDARHFTKFVAGAELNVALGVRRLGHSAGYLSKIGDDPFGRFIIASARAAGIDPSNLTTDSSHATGFYLKQKVSTGDPEIAYFRRHSAASNLTADDVARVSLDGVKIAHLTGISAALSKTTCAAVKAFNTRLHHAGITTVFDPNLRPALWSSRDEMISVTNAIAKDSQIVLPGINEGEILMGSRDPEAIADFYLSQSARTQTVIVKLGATGAFVKFDDGQTLQVKGFKATQVVDTVGAGDGFAVGLESALLEGKSMNVAVHRACAIGALAVQTPGDNDGYPTPEALQTFYEKNHYKEI